MLAIVSSPSHCFFGGGGGGTVNQQIFGVLLYLANLANCASSPIFVAANIYVDRTLHRRAARRRQI